MTWIFTYFTTKRCKQNKEMLIFFSYDKNIGWKRNKILFS